MLDQRWEHAYIGPRKRRYLSDTARAMRARKRRGAKGAHPFRDDTYQRVGAILEALAREPLTRVHVLMWARAWDISEARVEQLCAEARRTAKRLRRMAIPARARD